MSKTFKIGIGNVTVSEAAKKNVVKILESGRLSYGNYSRKFENQIAKLHSRKYAFFTNSGTSALLVALQVLKDKYSWGENDEVLVPAVTFVATANVVLHNRLKPVFVDVEPNYYCIDPKKIEEKISARTRAIIPVHLFGQSSDMAEVVRLAKKYHLKIIEDSCETMFVKYLDKPVGSTGDIACFSTYATHLITTGVGGLAACDDSDLAVRIKSYLNHGRDGIYLSIDDDDTRNPQKLFKIVERRFSFIYLGHSFRLTEMEAALGLDQLRRWRQIIKKRQQNAAFLTKKLSRWSQYLRLPSIRPKAEHAFMLYPITITSEDVDREKLIEFLEINGIETRYLMPLLNQPLYKKLFGNLEKEYPVAKMLNKNSFIIGCHQDLTKGELNHIVKVFEKFFKKI